MSGQPVNTPATATRGYPAAEGMVTLTTPEEDSPVGADRLAEPENGRLVITDSPDTGIFEGTVDGHTVAGIVYNRTGNHVALLATSVFPEYRGRGYAGQILQGVLSTLQGDAASVSVSCPFATAFVDAHPEYSDLVVRH